MRRFFLGNYDFEHQLAGEVYAMPGGSTPTINAMFASCWIGLAEDGDLISLPGRLSPDFNFYLREAGLPCVEFSPGWPNQSQAAEIELVPWGWSSEVKEIAARKGFEIDAPEASAVQTVNSRRFSFACEQEWELALPGSQQVHDLDELQSAIKELLQHPECQGHGWVVKADYSMSARERMLGQGKEITETVRSWAEKRFTMQQPLFLEPWVNRQDEAGLQFFIPREGAPQWIGLAPLVCDARGKYRGSRISVDAQTEEEWQPAIEVGHRVAERVQQTGYFGPLGIDAMCYADAQGTLKWRPIQDVNARYTMGRLALGFSRFLKPNEVASWLHFSWKESYGIRFSNWLRCHFEQSGSGTRCITTSPDQIDRQTLRLVNTLLISESPEQLRHAEADLLQAISRLQGIESSA